MRAAPGRDRRELGAIFAGGVVGAVLRVALLQTHAGAAPGWPWVTFAKNILGTLLLGYFATRLQERLPLSAYRRPLLGTGFCGAFTTFSTMQLELLTMLDAHQPGLALAYGASSVLAGYGSVHLATLYVRRAKDGGVSAPVWVGVGLLGGLGALLRFVVDGVLAARVGRDFPLGTFVVNLTGAATLGLLVGLGLTGDGLVLAGTATLGSYTTFSTWMLESQRLVEDGELALAGSNLLVSLIVGLGVAALGRFIGAHL